MDRDQSSDSSTTACPLPSPGPRRERQHIITKTIDPTTTIRNSTKYCKISILKGESNMNMNMPWVLVARVIIWSEFFASDVTHLPIPPRDWDWLVGVNLYGHERCYWQQRGKAYKYWNDSFWQSHDHEQEGYPDQTAARNFTTSPCQMQFLNLIHDSFSSSSYLECFTISSAPQI